MASKRNFKKQLNYMVFDIVEECFSLQLYNDKKTPETEKLIEEVIDFRNEMTAQVFKAKTKKEFPALHKMVEDKAVDFIHKLNEIQ